MNPIDPQVYLFCMAGSDMDGKFYVSAEDPETGAIYLHQDGQWRASTTTGPENARVYTGYFDTRAEAASALARAMGGGGQMAAAFAKAGVITSSS